MKKSNGSIILWVIALPLLAFTAFRSLHLIQSTLPPDAQIIAFAALAGLDGGLLAWLYFANSGARGAQRIIAMLMVSIDMAGIMAATIGDTLSIADPAGAASFVGPVAMWIVPLIIVLNVLGTVASHLVDPEQMIRNREREVQDAMEYGVAEHLANNASAIAATVVPQAAQHRAEELAEAFVLSSRVRNNSGGRSTLDKIFRSTQKEYAQEGTQTPIISQYELDAMGDTGPMPAQELAKKSRRGRPRKSS